MTQYAHLNTFLLYYKNFHKSIKIKIAKFRKIHFIFHLKYTRVRD